MPPNERFGVTKVVPGGVVGATLNLEGIDCYALNCTKHLMCFSVFL